MFFFRFSNRLLLFFIFVILFFKVVIYVYMTGFDAKLGLGGGSDANYYHAYAIGLTDNAVNFWPVILRFLNNIGLYNREFLAFTLFLLTLTIIPLVLFKTIFRNGYPFKQRLFLYVYLIFSLYPTFYFFTLDIYRDVAMFFSLLVSWFFLCRYYQNRGSAFLNLLAFFSVGYLCYLLRPYLGFAVISAFFIYYFYTKTARYTWLWVVVYFLGLMIFQGLGFFGPITEYRGVDGFADGGSTLGIGLHGRSPFVFIGLYIASFLGQVFGFFIVNFYSFVLLLVESIPFIFALRYVFKNKLYMNRFCHYLLTFFVIYTTVWVIGNDNLGTAVRLRFHSYMAIFVCFFIVYQNKYLYRMKN